MFVEMGVHIESEIYYGTFNNQEAVIDHTRLELSTKSRFKKRKLRYTFQNKKI